MSDKNAEILGDQDPSDFRITYHTTQQNAIDDELPLPNQYTNTTPFSEQIFIRIENRLSEECFDASQSLNLIVNPKPVAVDFEAFQCDEDGVADRRTVFGLASFDDSIADNAS